MPLLSFDEVSLAFGPEPLLDHASLQIDPGERVCLIGRNGAGKSTLLRIADGEQRPDSGVLWRQPGLRSARLAQELFVPDDASVFDVVAGGLHEIGALLAEYHRVALSVGDDPSLLRRLEFHYVPKHASWLNMVEIEIGVLKGQCLDRRIDEPKRLVTEVEAWERQRNAACARIKWMFTTDKARAKMGRAYPETSKES